ncbi:MAG: hypothetical protein C6W59_15105, partial [Paenibacillaceae bacterium]
MMERMLVLLLTGVALFALNASRVRRSGRRERWILASFGVPALYLAVMYLTDSDWPNLHDLANQSLGRIAHLIVKWLEQT